VIGSEPVHALAGETVSASLKAIGPKAGFYCQGGTGFNFQCCSLLIEVGTTWEAKKPRIAVAMLVEGFADSSEHQLADMQSGWVNSPKGFESPIFANLTDRNAGRPDRARRGGWHLLSVLVGLGAHFASPSN